MHDQQFAQENQHFATENQNLKNDLNRVNQEFKIYMDEVHKELENSHKTITDLEIQVAKNRENYYSAKSDIRQLDKIKKMMKDHHEDVDKFEGSLEIILQYAYDKIVKLEDRAQAVEKDKDTISHLENQVVSLNVNFQNSKGAIRQLDKIKNILEHSGEDIGKYENSLDFLVEQTYDKLKTYENKILYLDKELKISQIEQKENQLREKEILQSRSRSNNRTPLSKKS